MKNIIKSIIVMLSSVSLFTSANAGELSVSGTAKATYNILSGTTNVGKGLGITNELNFTASGELDNGYTWSYSMELDPGNRSGSNNEDVQNDDTKLTLTTPYGTVGVFISEGGLDVEDAASQSVYGRPTDIGDPSSTTDNYTIDSYNNVQYHTPADLLPFGISAKIAYAPDLSAAGDGASGNAKGAVSTKSTTFVGENATEYQVKASPIDGLTIGASYFERDEQGGAVKRDQDAESGAYYLTYASGPVSIGYSQAYRAEMLANDAYQTGTDVDYYDQTNYSIAFAASDDLSVSYERETSEANYIGSGTAAVEQESSAVQVAYTMGGMTIALSHASHDNNGYSTTNNQDQSLLAVTMAF
jgi:hypothetical protein